MHIPPAFAQKDNQELIRAITQFPFATLVAQLASPAGGASLLDAHHLPFNYCNDGDGPVLQAHVGKANPLWQQLPEGSEALTVFNGPHHYISPNYYPTKREHGRAVPTWNYVAVHVWGNIRYVHDPDWLAKVVGQMTAEQESSQATPWSLSDAPAEYIERMVASIVGVEIRITSMQGQWKLSQNQPKENIAGVIEGLNETGCERHQEMARWISAEQRD